MKIILQNLKHFITSIFILNEPLSFVKLTAFVIIWIAVVIFIIDVIIM